MSPASTEARPLVLLSNDDGYSAPGLHALHAALARVAEVVVCAPEVNQSATSHSLSLHRPLRLRRAEPGVFAIDGTPADCVYVALHSEGRVLHRAPDLVVSGINHGLNLGVDVFYSGTVAAAREGALRGIPAIALSAESGAKLAPAAELGARLAMQLLASFRRTREAEAASPDPGARTLPRGVLLNVNVPKAQSGRVIATRLGSRFYTGDVVYRHDPRGLEYLWIGGGGATHGPAPGSDTEAFDAGDVGVTPLSLDLFDPGRMPLAAEVASLATAPGKDA